MEISDLVKQNLKTDSELKRVEIFVLHHSIPGNTVKCLSSIIEHADWPYKLTVLSTNDYPKGLLAKMYNKLIKESTCDYVAFVCSDAKFNSPWIKKFMDGFSLIAKTGCVTPLYSKAVNEALNKLPDSGVHALKADEVSISVSLFLKEDILKFGGFDERFYLYGHDADLLKRMEKEGYHFFMDTSIVAEHNVGATTRTLFTKEEMNLIDKYNKTI